MSNFISVIACSVLIAIRLISFINFILHFARFAPRLVLICYVSTIVFLREEG
jgi:hypothetical protein